MPYNDNKKRPRVETIQSDIPDAEHPFFLTRERDERVRQARLKEQDELAALEDPEAVLEAGAKYRKRRDY